MAGLAFQVHSHHERSLRWFEGVDELFERVVAARERKERKEKKNPHDGPPPATLRSMRSFAAITNHDLTTSLAMVCDV